MRVIATDADEPGTKHSEIFYSLVEQSSSTQMFFINSRTGEIMVRQNTLDREVRRFTDPHYAEKILKDVLLAVGY